MCWMLGKDMFSPLSHKTAKTWRIALIAIVQVGWEILPPVAGYGKQNGGTDVDGVGSG